MTEHTWTEDHWGKISNRETVKTLLAMGFIPTWLEELLDYGDLINLQANEYVERNWEKRQRIELIVEQLALVETQEWRDGAISWESWIKELRRLSDLSINSKSLRT